VPEVGHHAPYTLARRLLQHDLAPETFTIDYAHYLRRQDFVFKTFDALSHPNLVKVYPHKKLCDEVTCKVYANDQVLYYDEDHLNLEGTEYIKSIFDGIF
jgi:hypothetical protein